MECARQLADQLMDPLWFLPRKCLWEQFNMQVPKGKGGGVEEVTGGRGAVTTEGFPRPGSLQTDIFL